ncbi:MAG: hypothetical protein F4040_03955 [Synechococcus sp. SB0670_bin_20]|nr:hypothetical protein [Synechococcus sp. SB0670_bin_20]
MTHNSNARHQAGGILMLLATGSLLLASCAAVARLDCADWNTREFFRQATAADVGRCLSQGADPDAKNKSGRLPVDFIPSDSPYAALNVYGQLHEARF